MNMFVFKRSILSQASFIWRRHTIPHGENESLLHYSFKVNFPNFIKNILTDKRLRVRIRTEFFYMKNQPGGGRS